MGTKKKITLMLIVIILLQVLLPMLSIIWQNEFTILSTAAGEEGKTEYYINTAQDLWNFAEKVNNGDTFEGITVYLTTDIKLECNEKNQWIPIGACYVDGGNSADSTDQKDPFAGVFEGNNHVISGVYIDTENNYAGLFGYNQGTIQNLKLKDSYIKSNKAYIGGISAFNKRNYKKLP